MTSRFIQRLVPKNLWNLVWYALGVAVVATALVNIIQSFIWYGKLSPDLLIIGTVDAIFVTLIVTPIVIKLGLMERERVEEELRALANTDELTKLRNRRGFFLLAEQLLKMCIRSKSGVYLMYIDLDYFKSINDTYGHAEGDRALTSFAALLRENYRESDIIARMGGDEFVLFPVGTTEDSIKVIRNRFNKVMEDFNQRENNPWSLSAAIGLGYFDPEHPISLDELLSAADSALYRQRKKRGDPPG